MHAPKKRTLKRIARETKRSWEKRKKTEKLASKVQELGAKLLLMNLENKPEEAYLRGVLRARLDAMRSVLESRNEMATN